jgi:hypothetical protein
MSQIREYIQKFPNTVDIELVYCLLYEEDLSSDLFLEQAKKDFGILLQAL